MMTQMKRPLTAAIAIFLPALSAAAPTVDEPTKPSSCAMVKSIDSWKDIDVSTVILITSPSRRYRVTFTAPCPDVKRGILALIQRSPGAGVCLSPGDSIVFARQSPVSRQNFDYDERCVIKTISAILVEAKTAPALN
jgi:hypothetical protein